MSDQNKPVNRLVTIVIPCYKGERYVAQAIESCLRQTHRDLEIIVVDDASPDRCAQIAEGYARHDSRVRVIRCPQNGGVSRAFNAGFNAGTGPYLTRLAQDDAFHEDAIEVLVRHLENRPEVGLAYGDLQEMDERGTPGKRCVQPSPDQVRAWGSMIGLAVMWRRSVWDRVGGFDPEFDTAEDYEYWFRVARSFPISKCPGGPYLLVRQHREQGSAVFWSKQEVLSNRIIRDYFSNGSVRSVLRRCRALSYVAFSSATGDSLTNGKHAQAAYKMLRSLLLWPLPYPRFVHVPPLLRVKATLVILLRLLRVRRDARPRLALPQPAPSR